MEYVHTQKAPLHYMLHSVAAILLISAWLSLGEPILAIILVFTGCLLVILALCFCSLTVSDDREQLSIRFGLMPIFRKSIAYSDITRVESGRSSFIDGWGIHYVPGRGWIYNLWGFDCVVVYLGKKVIRIGTDDVDNLVDFLNRRIGPEQS